MRRDYFTIEIDGLEADTEVETPTMSIDFEGPTEDLERRLCAPSGEPLEAEETDVAFRLHAGEEEDPDLGVISVTNRITGDYVLELNEDADTVRAFIKAARRYGKETGADNGRYRIRICADGENLVTYEKSTWLVYDGDGNLLRQRSLIPSGVEL